MNHELVAKLSDIRKRLYSIRNDVGQIRHMKRALTQYTALDVIQSAIGGLMFDVREIRNEIQPITFDPDKARGE